MEGIKKVWPKWEPVEVIGRGGFGTVYKAKREHFGEVSYSAIKVVKIPNDDAEVKEMTTSGLSKEHIKDYYKKSVLSLIDEIKLMEKMKSASHIVGIEDYEVVENEDGVGWKVYIRMELLTNLTDYFMNKEVTVNEVKKLGLDILKALEFCHEQNLIHRDIKPGNIFVSEFGEFKLGDFGISREVEKTNATMTGFSLCDTYTVSGQHCPNIFSSISFSFAFTSSSSAILTAFPLDDRALASSFLVILSEVRLTNLSSSLREV